MAKAIGVMITLVSLKCAAYESESDGPVAPPFVLPIIANGTGEFELSGQRGQITYIDYWASWCGPCRISLPALNSIYEDFKDKGFNVIAISVDVVEEDALDFLQRYPVSYPVLINTLGDVAKAYGVNGMPSGYLIDSEGVIRDVHIGFKRGDEVKIRESILELLEAEISR